MVIDAFPEGQETAVLLSGGLDSAVLVADQARSHVVHPVYVGSGLAWEAAERRYVERLLAALQAPGRLRPLAALTVDMRDVYRPTHWAVVGTAPAFDTPDEDVYILGRNIVLLSKTAVYCAQHRIGRIAIGPLAGNPFPDASPSFFAAMADALSQGLGTTLAIVAPFGHLHKADVIRLGAELGVPMELTLSCMQPREHRHCGQCSKCRERRDGFRVAGVRDPTEYAAPPPR
jgi:7-cyano-7-deazaguanine synthase